jgi:hypothetical protein
MQPHNCEYKIVPSAWLVKLFPRIFSSLESQKQGEAFQWAQEKSTGFPTAALLITCNFDYSGM